MIPALADTAPSLALVVSMVAAAVAIVVIPLFAWVRTRTKIHVPIPLWLIAPASLTILGLYELKYTTTHVCSMLGPADGLRIDMLCWALTLTNTRVVLSIASGISAFTMLILLAIRVTRESHSERLMVPQLVAVLALGASTTMACAWLGAWLTLPYVAIAWICLATHSSLMLGDASHRARDASMALVLIFVLLSGLAVVEARLHGLTALAAGDAVASWELEFVIALTSFSISTLTAAYEMWKIRLLRLAGWQVGFLALSIGLCLYIVNLEASITAILGSP